MSVASLAINRIVCKSPFDDGVIVVVGPSGSGKTHFVQNTLLQTITERSRYIDPYDACPPQPALKKNPGRAKHAPTIPSYHSMVPVLAIDELLVWDRSNLINTVNERIGNPSLTTILVVQTLACLRGIYDIARNPRIVTLNSQREASLV